MLGRARGLAPVAQAAVQVVEVGVAALHHARARTAPGDAGGDGQARVRRVLVDGRLAGADAGAEGLRVLCKGRTVKDHVLVPHGPAPLPPPRPVPWRALGVDLPIALFGGGVFVVTTILVLAMAFMQTPFWYDWSLDAEGVRTSATPYGVERTGVGTKRHGSIYAIHTQYVDGNGRARQGTFRTYKKPLIDAARRRIPIAIEYLPSDPAVFRPVGEDASAVGYAIFIPATLAFGAACVGLAGLAAALRSRALYRHGIAVQAHVVSLSRGLGSKHGRPVMRVHYGFADHQRIVESSYCTVDPPGVGSPIWIVCAPANPARHIVGAR